MTGIALLILIISSGYTYNHFHPEKKFILYRSEGQHLYFRSACSGLLLYGIACIFLLIFYHFSLENTLRPDILINKLFSKENFVLNLTVLTILSFSEILFVIFLYKLMLFLNKLSPQKKSFELSLLDKYPIEKLLFISANDKNIDNKLIMITFTDKKVYIGIVAPNQELLKNFSENHNIFSFIPFYSGYRNKDTLDVELTTNYQKRIQNDDKGDITILLDKDEIVSTAPINHKQFLDFLLKKTDKLEIEILRSIELKLVVAIFLKNKKVFLGKFSFKNDLDLISIRHQKNFLFQTMAISSFDNDELKLSIFSDEFNHHGESDLIFTVKKDDIENIVLSKELNTLHKLKTKLSNHKMLSQ